MYKINKDKLINDFVIQIEKKEYIYSYKIEKNNIKFMEKIDNNDFVIEKNFIYKTYLDFKSKLYYNNIIEKELDKREELLKVWRLYFKKVVPIISKKLDKKQKKYIFPLVNQVFYIHFIYVWDLLLKSPDDEIFVAGIETLKGFVSKILEE